MSAGTVHFYAHDGDGVQYEYRLISSRVERRRGSSAMWHFIGDGEWGDLVFHNEVPALRADRALLYYTLTAAKVIDGLSFVEELTKRGYDITTLRFSVHKRAAAGGQP